MKALTTKQHIALDVICQYQIEKGFPLTIRELGDALGISGKAAMDYVTALERKGYIRTQDLKPRTIEILKLASIYYGEVCGLPIQIAPKGTAKLSGGNQKC